MNKLWTVTRTNLDTLEKQYPRLNIYSGGKVYASTAELAIKTFVDSKRADLTQEELDDDWEEWQDKFWPANSVTKSPLAYKVDGETIRMTEMHCNAEITKPTLEAHRDLLIGCYADWLAELKHEDKASVIDTYCQLGEL